jgi:ribosome-binding protein aMBF1 (putative translation factor)
MKKKADVRSMALAKRKRLEAAGWKHGGVREFLGLSEAETALLEIRLALARGVRERRERRRLTQAALAKRIESSQSRVAKMEAGDPSVSLDLLVRTLLALGADPRELARIIGSAAA